MNYWLELNAQGYVVNIIKWDGVTEYNPLGMTLMSKEQNPQATYGWQYLDGQWIEPAPVEAPEEIE